MPIQIKQTFPRCQLCGKIIPPRAALVELVRPGQPAARFCSSWCRDEFANRLTPPTHIETAAPH